MNNHNEARNIFLGFTIGFCCCLTSAAFGQDRTGSSDASPADTAHVSLKDFESSTSNPDDKSTAVSRDSAQSQNAAPEGRAVFHAFLALTSGHPIDGATALTILLIGSFILHRSTTIIIWLLSLTTVWTRWFKDPSTIPRKQSKARSVAEAKVVVAYYFVAIVLAHLLLMVFCEIQLLGALGFTTNNPVMDCYLTGAIMIVGARRVGQWLDLPGLPGEEPASQLPVEVTGEVVLREPQPQAES